MKKRLIPIFYVGLSLLMVPVARIAAVPAPPAGRPKLIASFQGSEKSLRNLAFSPDGKLLASVDGEAHLNLWDAASGKSLAKIRANGPNETQELTSWVYEVSFSPDGKTIATGDANGNVKLWDVATRRNIDTLKVMFVYQLLFSPDGKSLICGSTRLDLEAKKERPLVKQIMGMSPVAAFDRKGKLWLATDIKSTKPRGFAIWDMKTCKIVHICIGRGRDITSHAFSPDGKTVVATEDDCEKKWGAVSLWDTATGKNTKTFDQQGNFPFRVVFGPRGDVLAVTFKRDPPDLERPDFVRLLDVRSGKVLSSLKGHKGSITCLAFSQKGRLLATGDIKGEIKIWRLPERYKSDK